MWARSPLQFVLKILPFTSPCDGYDDCVMIHDGLGVPFFFGRLEKGVGEACTIIPSAIYCRGFGECSHLFDSHLQCMVLWLLLLRYTPFCRPWWINFVVGIVGVPCCRVHLRDVPDAMKIWLSNGSSMTWVCVDHPSLYEISSAVALLSWIPDGFLSCPSCTSATAIHMSSQRTTAVSQMTTVVCGYASHKNRAPILGTTLSQCYLS